MKVQVPTHYRKARSSEWRQSQSALAVTAVRRSSACSAGLADVPFRDKSVSKGKRNDGKGR